MKEVVRYQAEDNTLHDTAADCAEYERRCALRAEGMTTLDDLNAERESLAARIRQVEQAILDAEAANCLADLKGTRWFVSSTRVCMLPPGRGAPGQQLANSVFWPHSTKILSLEGGGTFLLRGEGSTACVFFSDIHLPADDKRVKELALLRTLSLHGAEIALDANFLDRAIDVAKQAMRDAKKAKARTSQLLLELAEVEKGGEQA